LPTEAPEGVAGDARLIVRQCGTELCDREIALVAVEAQSLKRASGTRAYRRRKVVESLDNHVHNLA
jgi:hypothetical protein